MKKTKINKQTALSKIRNIMSSMQANIKKGLFFFHDVLNQNFTKFKSKNTAFGAFLDGWCFRTWFFKSPLKRGALSLSDLVRGSGADLGGGCDGGVGLWAQRGFGLCHGVLVGEHELVGGVGGVELVWLSFFENSGMPRTSNSLGWLVWVDLRGFCWILGLGFDLCVGLGGNCAGFELGVER